MAWRASTIGAPGQLPLRLNGFSEIPAKRQRRTVISYRVPASLHSSNQRSMPHCFKLETCPILGPFKIELYILICTCPHIDSLIFLTFLQSIFENLPTFEKLPKKYELNIELRNLATWKSNWRMAVPSGKSNTARRWVAKPPLPAPPQWR